MLMLVLPRRPENIIGKCETKRSAISENERYLEREAPAFVSDTTNTRHPPLKIAEIMLKGLAQAKIINKSVILFWLLNMTI